MDTHKETVRQLTAQVQLLADHLEDVEQHEMNLKKQNEALLKLVEAYENFISANIKDYDEEFRCERDAVPLHGWAQLTKAKEEYERTMKNNG